MIFFFGSIRERANSLRFPSVYFSTKKPFDHLVRARDFRRPRNANWSMSVASDNAKYVVRFCFNESDSAVERVIDRVRPAKNHM